ncbi:hypothetical protein HDU76_002783 [Blyttiomyces sp. JEL0837]|nr:hypothetical protein HDU76_002783 [Blyttiomyces sp. JEL0837]
MLRDVGSSSGTFLNRLRLSPSGKESRPYPIKSGDVIQLGVDYQGRQEEIYKCVMIKIFVSVKSKDPPKVNPKRLKASLRALLAAMNPNAQNAADASCTDCCICLSGLSPKQSLFLAPCSHCFHYRCVMPLLGSNVMFQCPLCRQVANLDAAFMEDGEDGLGGGLNDDGDGGMTAEEEKALVEEWFLASIGVSNQQAAATAISQSQQVKEKAILHGIPPSVLAAQQHQQSNETVDDTVSLMNFGAGNSSSFSRPSMDYNYASRPSMDDSMSVASGRRTMFFPTGSAGSYSTSPSAGSALMAHQQSLQHQTVVTASPVSTSAPATPNAQQQQRDEVRAKMMALQQRPGTSASAATSNGAPSTTPTSRTPDQLPPPPHQVQQSNSFSSSAGSIAAVNNDWESGTVIGNTTTTTTASSGVRQTATGVVINPSSSSTSSSSSPSPPSNGPMSPISTHSSATNTATTMSPDSSSSSRRWWTRRSTSVPVGGNPAANAASIAHAASNSSLNNGANGGNYAYVDPYSVNGGHHGSRSSSPSGHGHGHGGHTQQSGGNGVNAWASPPVSPGHHLVETESIRGSVDLEESERSGGAHKKTKSGWRLGRR